MSTVKRVDTYQVTYYGDSSYYVDAANCEIKNYIESSDCYCSTNGGSGCVDFVFFYSCGLLLDYSYQSNLQASYIIAIISIVIVAVYAFQTWLLFLFYRPPNFSVSNQRASHVGDVVVPTMATTVQPIVVHHNTVDETMTVTIGEYNDNFDNQTVVSGRVNPGKSPVREVTAELVGSYNSRQVVTSVRSINDNNLVEYRRIL